MSPVIFVAFGVIFMVGLPTFMAWVMGVLE